MSSLSLSGHKPQSQSHPDAAAVSMYTHGSQAIRQIQSPLLFVKSEDNAQIQELHEHLARIRRKRQGVLRRRQQLEEQQQRFQTTVLPDLELALQTALADYRSTMLRRHVLTNYLSASRQWNVLNDVCFIWHDGPWATINGVRLGGEAPRISPGLLLPLLYYDDDLREVTGDAPQQQQQQQQQQRRYLLWSNHSNNTEVSNNTDSKTSGTMSPTSSIANLQSTSTSSNGGGSTLSPASSSKPLLAANSDPPPKVPWSEINASLGHVVLLLQLLQEKGDYSLPHELHPLGSRSQVGVQRKNATRSRLGKLPPATLYPLHFNDDEGNAAAFQFLFRTGNLRNFHIGLTALLECVVAASTHRSDKTLPLPHAIVSTGTFQNGVWPHPTDWTIGGLTLQYCEDGMHSQSTSSTSTTPTLLEFTQACKYLLTDLKWLVAYATKHYVER